MRCSVGVRHSCQKVLFYSHRLLVVFCLRKLWDFLFACLIVLFCLFLVCPTKQNFSGFFFLRLLHYRNPFTSIYFEKLTIFFIAETNPVYFAVPLCLFILCVLSCSNLNGLASKLYIELAHVFTFSDVLILS